MADLRLVDGERQASEKVIELLDELRARAASGEVTGLAVVLEKSNGDTESVGTFDRVHLVRLSGHMFVAATRLAHIAALDV